MSLVSKECPRAIYKLLADKYLEDEGGLSLPELSRILTPRFEKLELVKYLVDMGMVGIVKREWASSNGLRREVYKIGNQTEWSALFANVLGYDTTNLGIPAYLADK